MLRSRRDTLLQLFDQNWLHIRHMENYRMRTVQIFGVVIAAVLYAISTGRLQAYYEWIALFLFIFSLIFLLIALKIEAVIRNFVDANYQIEQRLAIKEYGPLRTRKGFWKVIRFDWLFIFLYSIALVTSAIWLIFLLFE